MAEVANTPTETLEPQGGDITKDDNPPADHNPESSPPPPPPPQQRRRDRDSRERRDERDADRPPNRRGGDYPDRNRSPPPPRPRDYKRRASPSSPPPYRDRRGHSPPRRSPPFQPHKRSRRDEGGYEGRRGSPRGGYGGPGDRRMGYDSYEREGGGRPGYADDRPHGRFAGRSNGGYPGGSSDWESGRGGYNNASNTPREGMMSYKQFIQELEDEILPAEAERRYQEYKSEYISTQKRTFFDAHKGEDWFKDKYHPTNLVGVIERRNELARKMVKDFLLDLQSGTLDLGPGLNTLQSNKVGQTSEPNSEDEADANGKRRRHGRAPGRRNDMLAAPKAHPVCSEPRRILADVEQAQALVRKLDSEKGIEDNILSRVDNDRQDRSSKGPIGLSGPVVIVRGLTSVKGLEGVELLDTLLTYLWRIHGVDYYGLVETSEAKGLRHVRVDGRSADGSSDGGEWEKKLDDRWQERLKGQDPLEVMTGKEKIEAAAVEALDPYVRKIRDEKYGWKYGCGAKGCTKLFHAAEFVHKHLKLKHPELMVELTTKVREDLYFQNYMNDPDAPGGTPVMQVSVQKEKPQRRGPLDGRLKDDRGRRRDRDDRDNDRPEKQDFQSNDDGPAGGNPDEVMFDSFGGQGMHVAAPYSSDIPPPVLMPVPGAGPLGPFVPAPPEVAMRMFREQGGPSPFEGNGRNGRSGPQMNGPAPIIALPQAFRQDPRRLRSYQDLDAPEDEVTVIDYRSL